MAAKDQSQLTQRAYTLRLRGENRDDRKWRAALWETHQAVNLGAQVFGDWLLTLRGGIDHAYAEEKPAERRVRRVLLALSWLSVESRRGAPERFIVATGLDNEAHRRERVLSAFERILTKRGLGSENVAAWMEDCAASLCAAIREDAVWVNRSEAFDDAVRRVGPSLTRREIWDMLERFVGNSNSYFTPIVNDDEEGEGSAQETVKDLSHAASGWLSNRFGTGKAAEFARFLMVYQAVVAWTASSPVAPSGAGAIRSLAEYLKARGFSVKSDDLEGVKNLISGPGYKSATRNFLVDMDSWEHVTDADISALGKKAADDVKLCEARVGLKGCRQYSNHIMRDVEAICGWTYRTGQQGEPVSAADYDAYDSATEWGTARHKEFVVVLDHAARRVSMAHTWIKRAEAARSRFEDNARKIEDVPSAAKAWLDNYCEQRSIASGALEAYRIRRRAVDGWREVVAAWARNSCKTEENRIAVARALQDDPQTEKFGDIQLFEALAQDDAMWVWRKDGVVSGAVDAQPLLDYVDATEADDSRRRFKVPAYRHPDALLHPVFCDFGESRWTIDFELHRKRRLGQPRRLSMKLWNGRDILPVAMHWQSKRLSHDLDVGGTVQASEVVQVPRADRLGRAAMNISENQSIVVAGLFEQKEWNGRLQAPRRQLEKIAAIRDDRSLTFDQRAQRLARMIDRLPWLITFSANLQPMGPWCEASKDLSVSAKSHLWPHVEINKSRKGQAKLILSRLPELRVLSVDLGHRYAAACAVWQAVSARHVTDVCRQAGVASPSDQNLFLCIKTPDPTHPSGTQKTILYRRIGPDKLPDGTIHPAPWARLERQFLIKLQGEQHGARAASNEELWAVHQLEQDVGRTTPLVDRLVRAGWGDGSKNQRARIAELTKLGWTSVKQVEQANDAHDDVFYKPSLSVDELMSSTVRTMRLALKHHGDRARLAFAMTATYKPLPGNRKYYFAEPADGSAHDDECTRHEKHVEYMLDALCLWDELVSARGWQDKDAGRLWTEHITSLPGYRDCKTHHDGDFRVDRRAAEKERRNRLLPLARTLVGNAELRESLRAEWTHRWCQEDKAWQKRLRWFKDWILPRHVGADNASIWHVGGLSLTRIATLTEFRRRVQVSFYTRLRPDGTRVETGEHFGQSTLDALEHLREQRVRQLASRLVEAALGVGRVQSPIGGNDPKRPTSRVDKACHAIVIENLTRYRPEQTRTRRENRQLMSWSSSKVKNYLQEGCLLYGLHLREVSASYTSRQDSRTGAPGMRCQDVSVVEFMTAPQWRKQVVRAQKRQQEHKGDARERLLCDIYECYRDSNPEQWKKAGVVRIPTVGGEIFVSASSDPCAANGLQADLNAAANIGLRALLDPDWEGKWWYVPCASDTLKPDKEKVKGSAVVDVTVPLGAMVTEVKTPGRGRRKSSKSQSKQVINLWRDIAAGPLTEGEPWKGYAEYQNSVQVRVVQKLRQRMDLSKRRS